MLACTRCNTAKADKPFLVFLFAQRTRAERLYRFGQHLSEGILSILRPMVGELAVDAARSLDAMESPAARAGTRIVYGSDDDDSPYRETDSPYRMTG